MQTNSPKNVIMQNKNINSGNTRLSDKKNNSINVRVKFIIYLIDGGVECQKLPVLPISMPNAIN